MGAPSLRELVSQSWCRVFVGFGLVGWGFWCALPFCSVQFVLGGCVTEC